MRIPSQRTRRDMEVAAELRAQGATWQTIALKLNRQLALVHRWTRYYREEWERLCREAEERVHRQAADESRMVLRELLRSEKSNVRLAAAKRLARLRLQEKATEPPPARTDLAAWIQAAEEMTDEEAEECMWEFIREARPDVANALEQAKGPASDVVDGQGAGPAG
ncbi:MAG TPA: hypothetical protein VGZ47_22305 [Gemmataceae bacterium]|nr:hypothetical protein [Gemmataceae bacterium]